MNKQYPELNIDGKLIGENHPTYFIADIAANHDGELSRAKELIWLAKESGADAAKFQHFQAESIVSDLGFKSLLQIESHQSSWKKSVFEVYKDASIDLSWTKELKKTCDEAGITFLTSPYSISLVDEVDAFVPAYKIGSGDITWIEIIEYIASKQKPYILATGASEIEDVKRAVCAGMMINKRLALLQCNTNYTGSLENMKYVQLKVLERYKSMYPEIVLGLSDHTPGHATVLGAVTLGARIIEKHFTDDTQRVGPDHAFSMDQKSWSDMVGRTRELEAALGGDLKRVEDNERQTKILQRRGLYVRRELKAGSILLKKDLIPLRPCPAEGVEPYNEDRIIGKRLKVSKYPGEIIKYGDLFQ